MSDCIQQETLKRLVNAGAHIFPLANVGEIVKTNGTEKPSEEGKEPMPGWGSWNHRAATIEDVDNPAHAFRDWAVVPGSAGVFVVDVDDPDARERLDRLQIKHEVYLGGQQPSGTPGCFHRFYGLPAEDAKVSNGNWYAGAATKGGEIRGTSGYVKLHGDEYGLFVWDLAEEPPERAPEAFLDELRARPGAQKTSNGGRGTVRLAVSNATTGAHRSPERGDWTLEQVQTMLDHVPVEDDYDAWIGICFAAKFAGLSDEAIDQWSQGSHKYDEAARAKIASLEPDGSTGVQKLFALADQAMGRERLMALLRPDMAGSNVVPLIPDVDVPEDEIFAAEEVRFEKEFAEWWADGKGTGKGHSLNPVAPNSYVQRHGSEFYFEDDFLPPVFLRRRLEKTMGDPTAWGLPQDAIDVILEWGRKEMYRALEGDNDEISHAPAISNRFSDWCDKAVQLGGAAKASPEQQKWAAKIEAYRHWSNGLPDQSVQGDAAYDLMKKVWTCVREYPHPFIDDPYELAGAMTTHFSGAAKARGEERAAPTDKPPFVAVSKPGNDNAAWYRVVRGEIGIDLVNLSKNGSTPELRDWVHSFAKGQRKDKTRVYGAMKRGQGADGRWKWFPLNEAGRRTLASDTLNTLAGYKPFGYHHDSVDSDGGVVGVPGGGKIHLRDMIGQQLRFIGEKDRVWSPLGYHEASLQDPVFRKIVSVPGAPYDNEAFRNSEFYAWLCRAHPDGRDRLSRQVHAGMGMLGAKKRSGSIAIDWGPGGSGKSSYGQLIAWALGDDGNGYAADVAIELFIGKGGASFTKDSALAALEKLRFVICSELDTEGNHRLLAGILKRVFGGDGVSARLRGENAIIIRLLLAMHMSMNERPSLSKEDQALLDRLRVNNVMPRIGPEDKGLFDRIKTKEAKVIVRWILDGAAAAFLLGDLPVTPHQAVQAAHMVAQANPVGAWLRQRFEPAKPKFRVPLKDAHALFVEEVGDIKPTLFQEAASKVFKIARVKHFGSQSKALHIIGVTAREELE